MAEQTHPVVGMRGILHYQADNHFLPAWEANDTSSSLMQLADRFAGRNVNIYRLPNNTSISAYTATLIDGIAFIQQKRRNIDSPEVQGKLLSVIRTLGEKLDYIVYQYDEQKVGDDELDLAVHMHGRDVDAAVIDEEGNQHGVTISVEALLENLRRQRTFVDHVRSISAQKEEKDSNDKPSDMMPVSQSARRVVQASNAQQDAWAVDAAARQAREAAQATGVSTQGRSMPDLMADDFQAALRAQRLAQAKQRQVIPALPSENPSPAKVDAAMQRGFEEAMSALRGENREIDLAQAVAFLLFTNRVPDEMKIDATSGTVEVSFGIYNVKVSSERVARGAKPFKIDVDGRKIEELIHDLNRKRVQPTPETRSSNPAEQPTPEEQAKILQAISVLEGKTRDFSASEATMRLLSLYQKYGRPIQDAVQIYHRSDPGEIIVEPKIGGFWVLDIDRLARAATHMSLEEINRIITQIETQGK